MAKQSNTWFVVSMILIGVLVIGFIGYKLIIPKADVNTAVPTNCGITTNGFLTCSCLDEKPSGRFSVCTNYEFVEVYQLPYSVDNNIHFRDDNGQFISKTIRECSDIIGVYADRQHPDGDYTDEKYRFVCIPNSHGTSLMVSNWHVPTRYYNLMAIEYPEFADVSLSAG